MTVPFPLDEDLLEEEDEDEEDHRSPPFFAHFCHVKQCLNDAQVECGDCFLRFCRECIQTYLDMSPAYQRYDESSHQYICIYCFIEEQEANILNN